LVLPGPPPHFVPGLPLPTFPGRAPPAPFPLQRGSLPLRFSGLPLHLFGSGLFRCPPLPPFPRRGSPFLSPPFVGCPSPGAFSTASLMGPCFRAGPPCPLLSCTSGSVPSPLPPFLPVPPLFPGVSLAPVPALLALPALLPFPPCPALFLRCLFHSPDDWLPLPPLAVAFWRRPSRPAFAVSCPVLTPRFFPCLFFLFAWLFRAPASAPLPLPVGASPTFFSRPSWFFAPPCLCPHFYAGSPWPALLAVVAPLSFLPRALGPLCSHPPQLRCLPRTLSPGCGTFGPFPGGRFCLLLPRSPLSSFGVSAAGLRCLPRGSALFAPLVSPLGSWRPCCPGPLPRLRQHVFRAALSPASPRCRLFSALPPLVSALALPPAAVGPSFLRSGPLPALVYWRRVRACPLYPGDLHSSQLPAPPTGPRSPTPVFLRPPLVRSATPQTAPRLKLSSIPHLSYQPPTTRSPAAAPAALSA